MIIFPNAKINIGLNVLGKRPDGYHQISSCFYPIGLSDALEILPAENMSFEISGIPLPDEPADRNLVWRAYDLVAREYRLPPAQIHLLKAIPVGAGLGGGSSDAACCIKLVNELFDLGMRVEEQWAFAQKLGSDCAFFIENRPVHCSGRGEIFEDIGLSLKGYHLVLVHPGIHISTAEAYAGVVPGLPDTGLRELVARPMEEWRDTIVNDFEKTVFRNYPGIASVKAGLYEAGALYASMSGSGSSVYGIFKEFQNFYNNFSGHFVWQGELN